MNFNKEPIISVTIDIDWAPPESVQYILDVLKVFEIRATIFATLGTPKEMLDGHDIGIHPNFEGGIQDIAAMRCEIMRCLEKFPDARCLRSHALFSSSWLYRLIKDEFPQIECVSNVYIPIDHVCPFIGRGGFPELPLFWMDDAHLFQKKSIKSQAILDDVTHPGLKIFAFHPFHVYINAQDKEHVSEAREAYHVPADLWNYHRRCGDGVNMLLLKLLGKVKKENWKIFTCHEISDFVRCEVAQ